MTSVVYVDMSERIKCANELFFSDSSPLHPRQVWKNNDYLTRIWLIIN